MLTIVFRLKHNFSQKQELFGPKLPILERVKWFPLDTGRLYRCVQAPSSALPPILKAGEFGIA
jgi:hypothetical protein